MQFGFATGTECLVVAPDRRLNCHWYYTTAAKVASELKAIVAALGYKPSQVVYYTSPLNYAQIARKGIEQHSLRQMFAQHGIKIRCGKGDKYES